MSIYVEGVLSMSWNVESGAHIEEKADFLKMIERLERYMI